MSIQQIASYPMPAASAMLSNRVHWKPDPARAVLLLHDMQEYFLDFYDGKEEPIPTFLEHIGRLRETCDIASVPVVAQLAPREQDTVLVKLSYSAFVRSDLLQRMQVQCRDQLIMCGVYAHTGCLMTSADAFMNDIQPFLVGDALADFSAEQHAMALDYFSQRCGVVKQCTGRDRLLTAGDHRRLPASMAAL